nr:MAG TPA: hypothetical protein [Caudoviricetes sp.]DAY88738.1 MAG TPA: hypothetical protein [Caudoviricetes sp.]
MFVYLYYIPNFCFVNCFYLLFTKIMIYSFHSQV